LAANAILLWLNRLVINGPAKLLAQAPSPLPDYDGTMKKKEGANLPRKPAPPPVHGSWSLSIYNDHHLFVANSINRFSVGTKNKRLECAPGGSLTIYVQADPPPDKSQRAAHQLTRTRTPKFSAAAGSSRARSR
jgi:hypothetical protein